MSTPAAAQSAAARRHSVTPPHSEASTLTRSTAPASRSRRTPWLVISLCPAVMGIRVAWRTRAMRAASSYQWHGSSNQRTSRGSMRRAKRTASCADQPRLASTARTKSGPAARRATSTRSAVGFHLAPDIRERLAFHVVPADGDDGEPAPVAAEERAHALAERLADEIPERAVDAGDGLEQGLAVAARMGEREHRLPHALALEDAHADHPGGEGLVDQPRDLEPVLAVVTVVDLADEARVGPHARDDGA